MSVNDNVLPSRILSALYLYSKQNTVPLSSERWVRREKLKMTTSDLPYPSTATGNQSSLAAGLSKANPSFRRCSSIGGQRESGVERRSVAGEGR